jgi:UDP-N-acetylglucosamine 2-epimerase (non-hydrolysing)
MARIKRLKVLNVVGARPNLIKMAAILEAMKRRPQLKPILLHTGQHYDYELYRVFFKDLNLALPQINLGVGSGTHPKQIAKIMSRFDKSLKKVSPDLVVVFGDVNSTLACALVTAQARLPLVHVEAGLRSFDRRMPEEINRILTDSLSDYLFTTCQDANENLLREGTDKRRIFFVGNVMIDTLLRYKDRAKASKIMARLNIENQRFALLTLHRPENVDNKNSFLRIIKALKVVSRSIKIIYSLHPRSRKQLEKFGLLRRLKETKNLLLIRPCGYLDFIKLLMGSVLVLTDSGGIQEEATILGIPCLTLRQNTERPITVARGTNKVVGTEPQRIVAECEKILAGRRKKPRVPMLWDGRAAGRIAEILMRDKSLR